MTKSFLLSDFNKRFPTDELCLDEIKMLRYPRGIYCKKCRRNTQHYKLTNRLAYSCKDCRSQVYPLAGTLFDKSTTSLRTWFFALFIMTHLRAQISATQLQEELGVTYKTAWRIKTGIKKLMEQNDGDLLYGRDDKKNTVRRWSFFNAIEISVVQKEGEE